MSGIIVDLLDHVVIGFLEDAFTACITLAIKWWSTNGPFRIERDTLISSQ